MNNFNLKKIEISIILNDSDIYTFNNYPSSVKIEKVGIPDKNKAFVTIYGLDIATMDKLTTLAYKALENQKNVIIIKAGDEYNSEKIFSGEISMAYADFNAAPNVAFHIRAMTAFLPSLTSIPATNKEGINSISSIILELSKELGYTFTNEGVEGTINNPYLIGSAFEQLTQLSNIYAFELVIDDDEVIIIPKNKIRKNNKILLNRENGMINYPSFTNDGISVRSVFNSKITYSALVEIDSIVPKSSGLWKITKLTHQLSTNLPSNIVWETQLEAIAFEE